MSTETVPAPVDGAQAPAQESAPVQEPGFKVFAGNLTYATTDEGLRAFFAPVADDIVTAQVIHRGTRSAGYGFVTLSNEAAVEKAVAELNRRELDGRQAIVEAAKPLSPKEPREKKPKKKSTAGRRGNKAPPGEVTDAEANGEVQEKTAEGDSETDGKPQAAKKAKKPRKKVKKDANGDVINPATGDDAAANGNEDGAAKKPAKRAPRAPRTPRVDGEPPVGEPSKSVLFVANLAFNVTDEALGEIFTSAGIHVVSARVVKRRFGQPRRSKGYGFVDVGNEDEQKKALEHFTNNKEVSGREIAVKVAIGSPHEDDEEKAADTDAAPVPTSVPSVAPDVTVLAQ